MPRRRIALLAVSATVTVAFGTMLYAFSVLVTDQAAGSEFSTGILSLAYGGTVLVSGGLAFAIGRVVDRRGVRVVMGAGALLGAAGMGAIAISAAGWQIVAASWLLLGPAGAMTFYEPAFVAVDQWFEPADRGRVIGILTVIGGLAGPVFLPATAALVDWLGWRPTAASLGALLGVVGLASAVFLIPSGVPGRPTRHVPNVRLRVLLGDRRFARYTAGMLLMAAGFQTVIFHRIALFEDAGLAVGVVAFWAGVSGWFSFPGRYFGPVLADRASGLRWNAGAGLALAATVSMLVAPGGRVAMVLHFVAFGVVFGAILPMRAAVMGRWFSGARFGRIMGLQWTVVAFAGAAGPYLAGVSRDVTGGYGTAMMVTVLLLIASSLVLLSADREGPAGSGETGTQ